MKILVLAWPYNAAKGPKVSEECKVPIGDVRVAQYVKCCQSQNDTNMQQRLHDRFS
jgi:hypothetical protein